MTSKDRAFAVSLLLIEENISSMLGWLPIVSVSTDSKCETV
jgi:hypothetical protein